MPAVQQVSDVVEHRGPAQLERADVRAGHDARSPATPQPCPDHRSHAQRRRTPGARRPPAAQRPGPQHGGPLLTSARQAPPDRPGSRDQRGVRAGSGTASRSGRRKRRTAHAAATIGRTNRATSARVLHLRHVTGPRQHHDAGVRHGACRSAAASGVDQTVAAAVEHERRAGDAPAAAAHSPDGPGSRKALSSPRAAPDSASPAYGRASRRCDLGDRLGAALRGEGAGVSVVEGDHALHLTLGGHPSHALVPAAGPGRADGHGGDAQVSRRGRRSGSAGEIRVSARHQVGTRGSGEDRDRAAHRVAEQVDRSPALLVELLDERRHDARRPQRASSRRRPVAVTSRSRAGRGPRPSRSSVSSAIRSVQLVD